MMCAKKISRRLHFLCFIFLHSPLFHLICLCVITFHRVCPAYTPLHQTVMVSLEGLSKIVDPSQLTADFEGSLEYNHDDWIEVWMLSLNYFVPLLL